MRLIYQYLGKAQIVLYYQQHLVFSNNIMAVIIYHQFGAVDQACCT